MSQVFESNHAKLAAEPRFAEIAHELAALSPIDSRESFNRYCREACRRWNEQFREGLAQLRISLNCSSASSAARTA